MVTLGCARNEVDSEELAGRLEAGGFRLVDDPADAETVVVNTCGFVEAAKKDSVDTLLAAADLKDATDARRHAKAVVAVGCLAERYGAELADSLPEADAVLGFDDYPDIADRLRSILAGETLHPHTPQDRRKLLPISPADRVERTGLPARARRPAPARRRPDGAAQARLGLRPPVHVLRDPAFRGSFVSRRPSDVLAEARWLAGQGARELFLVSENSTSYGKDLGDLRLLETMLPELAAVDGVERVRVSYLQPAETRPGLVTAIASTPGVAPYFDLSFQHASHPVLRRMRRFGDSEAFLGLLEQARAQAPEAGARSNFIVGFPGETEDDLEVLCDFLDRRAARRDRHLRLLRRGRHRGRGLRRQARRGRDPRAGRARHRPGRGADRPAGRGADRRAGRRAGGVARAGPDRDGGRRRGPRGPPGPRGRRLHDAAGRARGRPGR